jgi:hypothetical protein
VRWVSRFPCSARDGCREIRAIARTRQQPPPEPHGHGDNHRRSGTGTATPIPRATRARRHPSREPHGHGDNHRRSGTENATPIDAHHRYPAPPGPNTDVRVGSGRRLAGSATVQTPAPLPRTDPLAARPISASRAPDSSTDARFCGGDSEALHTLVSYNASKCAPSPSLRRPERCRSGGRSFV